MSNMTRPASDRSLGLRSVKQATFYLRPLPVLKRILRSVRSGEIGIKKNFEIQTFQLETSAPPQTADIQGHSERTLSSTFRTGGRGVHMTWDHDLDQETDVTKA